MKETSLDMQSVQGTMLLPLWGRAEYSKRNPDILDDRTAIEIVENLDFDFSGIERNFGEFGGICYIVRARRTDDEIRSYLKDHPHATVVNIGSGLDTTFSRVDNGTVKWYNMDLPDAIAFRRSLIPDSERNVSIAKSFFDTTWFDDIEFDEKDGILFSSAGVFYYFENDDMRKMFGAMAERFPGGRVYFDAESKMAVGFSNRMVKKTGNKGAMMHFYVNSERSIAEWTPKIDHVASERYFAEIPKKERWGLSIRMRMAMMDSFGMMKFIRVVFSPSARGSIVQ